jgi:hypothetical protein
VHYLQDLSIDLAEPNHDPGLGPYAGMSLFEMLQQVQRILKIRTETHVLTTTFANVGAGCFRENYHQRVVMHNVFGLSVAARKCLRLGANPVWL